jgi:hypothetical protein
MFSNMRRLLIQSELVIIAGQERDQRFPIGYLVFYHQHALHKLIELQCQIKYMSKVNQQWHSNEPESCLVATSHIYDWRPSKFNQFIWFFMKRLALNLFLDLIFDWFRKCWHLACSWACSRFFIRKFSICVVIASHWCNGEGNWRTLVMWCFGFKFFQFFSIFSA